MVSPATAMFVRPVAGTSTSLTNIAVAGLTITDYRTFTVAGTEPPEVLASWSCHEVPVFTHDEVWDDDATYGSTFTANGGRAAMPTIGLLSVRFPREPRKPASP